MFEGQVLSLTRGACSCSSTACSRATSPSSELPRDQYRLNELETALEGRRSGRAYKLADLLPVRVIGSRRSPGEGRPHPGARP